MTSKKKVEDEEEAPKEVEQATPHQEPPKEDPVQIIMKLTSVIQEQQKRIEQLEANMNSIMEYLKGQAQQSTPQGGPPQGGGILEALAPLLGKLMEPAKDPLRDLALELMVESMKSNVEMSKAITQKIVQGIQDRTAKKVVDSVVGVISHE